MGLRRWIATLAVQRAHVLVVADPAAFRLRTELERGVRARGWVLALTPADADVLALCGLPGGPAGGEPGGEAAQEEDSLMSSATALWEAMSAPRVRIAVDRDSDLEAALAHAGEGLSTFSSTVPADGGHARAGRAAAQEDTDMAPYGIPLADGTEDDRDGLEMDVLHVPLGPVLPHWPAGLVLRCVLHGDLIAEVEVALPRAPEPGDAVPPAAICAEAAADVLALAGWPAGYEAARQARDAFLDGDQAAGAHLCDELGRRIRRHRVVGWMLKGLGPLSEHDLATLPEPWSRLLAGDVLTRVRALLEAAADPSLRAVLHASPDESSLAALIADAVRGLEVSAARLVVASLAVPGLVPTQEHVDV